MNDDDEDDVDEHADKMLKTTMSTLATTAHTHTHTHTRNFAVTTSDHYRHNHCTSLMIITMPARTSLIQTQEE